MVLSIKHLTRHIIRLMALICLLPAFTGQVYAVWYEAKGQAIIVNGNKEEARQNATQEALKQALLFAGASISSVQQLTNGLLENENITISSYGEVNALELTDEVWHSDYVTVSIRADIFPLGHQCSAGEYEKTFATSYFLVENRHQLVDGKIPNLSEAVTKKLAQKMATMSNNMVLRYIVPHTTLWQMNGLEENVRALAQQANSQFVLVGTLDDISVEREQASVLAFWKKENAIRHFNVTIRLYDGINGGLLLHKRYDTSAAWNFDRFADLDEFSAQFWQSVYGQAIQKEMHTIITDLSEATACQPMTGRVIGVSDYKVSISLGKDNGIEPGDELYVYQTHELIDSSGTRYLQYHIYPGIFVVENAYSNTATIRHKDTDIIPNIQENDFVVKK